MYEKSKLRWSLYTLPNGREVYLTQRPDVATKKSVIEFEKNKKPLIRFNFCDDFVKPGKTPHHWLPWHPSKPISLENLFAFISMMNYFNNKNNSKPIWIHCDSSSMRAPTHFGLFLKAIYPKEEIQVCEGMRVSENNDFNYASHSRADIYAKISIEKDTGVKEFIQAWKLGGEELAHQNMMRIRKII